MGKNARESKFFCDFIEISQFDEAAFMEGFQVVEVKSVMIIEVGPCLVLRAPFLHNCPFYQTERIR